MDRPFGPYEYILTLYLYSASRGIGYELVRQLVSSSDNLVVAACRSPEKATALHALKSTSKGQLHLVQMDTGDFDSIRASFGQVEPILGEIGLDYLINNAGVVSFAPTCLSRVA